jgi:Type III flagellar switch regulator (C-ring) FliN C-term
MISTARPFCVWSDAAVDHVRRRAQAAVDAWAREWVGGTAGADHSGFSVHVTALSSGQAPMPSEYEEMRGALAAFWVRVRAADRSACSSAVVGPDLAPGGIAADDWVAQVVDRAWFARNRCLCSALLGEPEFDAPLQSAQEPPVELVALGSGALQISCEPIGLKVLVDRSVMSDVPPVVRGTAHRLPPIVPIDQAVRPAMLHVQATLGSVELKLEEVLDMQCGDVLRLPQRLDQLLSLSCAGQPLASAKLGDAAGRLAVQAFADRDRK